jgi:hypothetical protein
MGFIALFLMGTYLLADAMSYWVVTPDGRYEIIYPEWSRVANPVMGWQELAMTPYDPPDGFNGFREWYPRLVPDKKPQLMAPLAGVGVYALAAGLLWWLALRRFEREGRTE